MTPRENVTLGLIVEGHVERDAAPILARHIAREFNFYASIKCEARRVPKSQLVRPGELERAVEALTRQIGRTRPILVLLTLMTIAQRISQTASRLDVMPAILT